MKKKILAILFALALATTCLTGCGSNSDEAESVNVDKALQGIFDNIDVDFAVETTDGIAKCGTDEELGYRLAGSQGENDAVNYLEGRFKEAGLEDVTVHETNLDTWSMTKCNLSYENAKGKEKTMAIGSYQTTFESNNQEYDLVYLNEGTAADYEGFDATGKVVLVDIDQSENWWVNWPAYQAKVKGAACIITAQSGGYGQKDGDTIQAQDICGPADAPALSVSNNQADKLKKLIKKSKDKSIKIKIDCDAKVINDGTSHNVSGVIPGKTDEIIFLMGHIDGYFHAWHDNASGIGMALGIAKAIKDSGYTPEKTIIVSTHGAEEWGVENSRYDWMIGAYEQINTITPEWAEKGFAVLNCESGCARDDDEYLALGCSYELNQAATDVIKDIDANSSWEKDSKVVSPATCWSEDFVYARAGVPGMVTKKTSGNFNLNSYHTNRDVKDDHYSEANYKYSHEVYTAMLYEFDQTPIEPLNFNTRINAITDDVNKYCPNSSELKAAAEDASATAKELNAKIKKMNKNADVEEAIEFNKKLREAFKFSQNNLTAFDWEDNVMFPHNCTQANIENLQKSIKALKKGNINKVVDDYLYNIDYNWYAYDFDEETYNFFVNQTLEADNLMWGEGMIKQGNENLFAVVKSLNEKYDSKDADVTEEIAILEQALAHQKELGNQIVQDEINSLNTLNDMMKAML